MKRICTALSAIAILLGLTSCSDTMYKAVKYENIPVDIGNTTLLVPKFEHQDPTVYDPVYVKGSGDSIRKVSPFKYNGGKMDTIKQAEKKEHPLIVETNAHLDQYNKRLEKTWRKYKYKYLIVEGSKVDQMPNYDDKNTYKYMLMRKPVLHCYENPDGTTLLSYRYMFWFHDRQNNSDLPEIEVFSTSPERTQRAIIKKINHDVKQKQK